MCLESFRFRRKCKTALISRNLSDDEVIGCSSTEKNFVSMIHEPFVESGILNEDLGFNSYRN